MASWCAGASRRSPPPPSPSSGPASPSARSCSRSGGTCFAPPTSAAPSRGACDPPAPSRRPLGWRRAAPPGRVGLRSTSFPPHTRGVRLARVVRLALQLHVARQSGVDAEDGLHELGAAGANEPREAEDLPLACSEARAFRRAGAAPVINLQHKLVHVAFA